MEVLDQVSLNFSQNNLTILNICLAFVMFGVALEIKVEDFMPLFKKPKKVIIGYLCQFLLLPAATFGLVYFLEPTPSVALGMILIAACPGGNISNFYSNLAGGNAALSVTLTAFAVLSAIFMTPFNFSFWGGLYEPASGILQSVEIETFEMFKVVALLLGIPLVLGMAFARQFPDFTAKILKTVKGLSMVIFMVIVGFAFVANWDYFLNYIHLIVGVVFVHNFVALFIGYSMGWVTGLPEKDRRTLCIETGIQNSGLGLVLIFNFFDGLGGMAFIAAWWGIWHMVSGFTMAFFFTKFGVKTENE